MTSSFSAEIWDRSLLFNNIKEYNRYIPSSKAGPDTNQCGDCEFLGYHAKLLHDTHGSSASDPRQSPRQTPHLRRPNFEEDDDDESPSVRTLIYKIFHHDSHDHHKRGKKSERKDKDYFGGSHSPKKQLSSGATDSSTASTTPLVTPGTPPTVASPGTPPDPTPSVTRQDSSESSDDSDDVSSSESDGPSRPKDGSPEHEEKGARQRTQFYRLFKGVPAAELLQTDSLKNLSFERHGSVYEPTEILNERLERTTANHKLPQPRTKTGGSTEPLSLKQKYGKCCEVVGFGAHARVHLVHSKSSNLPQCEQKMYAVKRFRKQRKDESPKQYRKKLFAEFCISSAMHHENVVETVDLLEDNKQQLCVVMEYAAGGDLFNLLKSQPLSSQGEINCLFKQLMNGVAYLHKMGVAHRDLKPENLLLDASGRILKIADFGVADVYFAIGDKAPRKVKGLCGSEPYIAPEEFEDNCEYDPTRVDIWACAIIYYTMQYQAIPWRRATSSDPQFSTYLRVVKEKLQDSCNKGFDPFDQLPQPQARKLIYQMLDPCPANRPSADQIQSNDEWFRGIEVCKKCTKLGDLDHVHTISCESVGVGR